MTGTATSLSLRPAGPQDVPRIVEIVEAAYRGEGGWTTESSLVGGTRTHAGEVQVLLGDPDVDLVVAAPGEDPEAPVVGCCYTSRDGDRAEFGLFAVDPAAQSGGIGRALLEEQVRRCAERGVRVLEIHVLQSRPELHAWYERHGFVPTGQTIPFAGRDEDLKVPGLGMDVMERDLTAS